MNDRPEITHYTLKQPRCPCCRGEGALILACCARCRAGFGVCEESGEMVDLQKFEVIAMACPGCTTAFANFADIRADSLAECLSRGYREDELIAATGHVFN